MISCRGSAYLRAAGKWVMQYRIAPKGERIAAEEGSPCFAVVGLYQAVSLVEARFKVRRFLVNAIEGKDPQQSEMPPRSKR